MREESKTIMELEIDIALLEFQLQDKDLLSDKDTKEVEESLQAFYDKKKTFKDEFPEYFL